MGASKKNSRRPRAGALALFSLLLLLATASFVLAESLPKPWLQPLPAASSPVAKHPTLSIVLQPLGDFPAEDLASIQEGLKTYFFSKVTILPSIPLPKRGFTKSRGRFRASDLLDYLGNRCPKGYKIMGITAADISITKGANNDWGVFGLGDLSGPAGIVSSYRIKTDPATRRSHLLTVVRHELGHMLGLRHCSNLHCLMAAGDGLDIQPVEFCPRCIRIPAPYLRNR